MLTIFYILSAITLGSAFLTILNRNPIHSAIWLVVCFFSIAGHYALFNAQFLAMVHLIVYSGAIMILMLFTIMMMNFNKERQIQKKKIVVFAGVVSLCLVGYVLLATFIKAQPIIDQYYVSGEDYQSIKVLGQVLLEDYVIPFEMAAILLLVSMVGAVLLSKKDKKEKKSIL
ncbi:MAG: NADH-quinone oxidoreductase subunit J [Flavobacteriaceae bacterium]|jgi:NADH-quinone oxidoreductase subunit J|nr:NADH-quinone oxidoreductase subunit J [Flavobacteriaceae bacterium]